jgi:hypothetical protein
MRTRLVVLASVLCGLTTLAAPTMAAAPSHNRGLTINVTPNSILAGEGVFIYGQLDGADIANQRIVLYHRINPQQRFSVVGTTTIDDHGFYEFTRAEGIVRTNRSWFVGGPGATHSRTVHERVAALVTLSSDKITDTTFHHVILGGSVYPAHRYQHVLLQVQEGQNGNGWRTIAHTSTGPDSRFDFNHVFRIPGDYTLRALFPGDPRNIAGASDSVTLVIQQAQIPSFTINTSEPIVPVGHPVSISGVLDRPGTTKPLANIPVTLWGHQEGTREEALATTVTGKDGSYSFTQTPVRNTVYLVSETLKRKTHSALLFEGAQDVVSASSSSSTATVGGSVTIRGTVTPDKQGHWIYLQRLGADDRWHAVEGTVVGSGSTYSFTYTFGQAGSAQLRARIFGGPENIGSASPAMSVTVSGTA